MAADDDDGAVAVVKNRRVGGGSTGAVGGGGGGGRSCGVALCGCGAAGAGWGAALAAEALGTALLVMLGCAGCGAAAGAGAALQPLVFPLVVLAMVQSFDHISGAVLNPAISLAAAVARRLCARRAAFYSAAQLAGAAVGAAALAALLPPETDPACSVLQMCVTRPRPDLPLFKAVCVEAALTAALALANCAAWDARNRRLLDAWPLRLALLLAGLSLAGGWLTGASMNPARSLAPALLAADFADHWVYWAGPLGGAVLYRRLWAAPPGAPARGAGGGGPAAAAAAVP